MLPSGLPLPDSGGLHPLLRGVLGGAFAPFRLANAQHPLILKYHRFSTERNSQAVSRQLFAEQLRYLIARYQIVSIPKIVAQLEAGTPLSRPMAAITIDDGHRDAYEIALPVLRQFGAPATVFVVTGFLDQTCWLWPDQVRYMFARTRTTRASIVLGSQLLDVDLEKTSLRARAAALVNDGLKQLPEEEKNRALGWLSHALKVRVPELPPAKFAPITWDQAREMDKIGVAVESHTMTHPILTQVGTDQLSRELAASKARLEHALNRRVSAFCYPNGNWNRQVRDAVERAGYAFAVTTVTGFNQRGADPFCLKRIDGNGGLPRFAKSTSGFDLWQRRVRRAGSTLLAARLERRSL